MTHRTAADPSLGSLFLTTLVGSFAYHAYILAQNAALADYIPDSRGLAVATARTMSMMGVSQVAGNVLGCESNRTRHVTATVSRRIFSICQDSLRTDVKLRFRLGFLGIVLRGYMTAFGTRLPFFAGAACALTHAAVITLGLRETNSPRLRAEAAAAAAASNGGGVTVEAAGVESGGASPWEVVLAVVNVVRKDPLAPLSSVRKLFISGRAVRWLSLAQVAAEMIDRTHHLRVLVAFDRLRWVRKANERFALQAEDKY